VATALIGYLRTQPADAAQQLAALRNYTNSDVVMALAAYYSATGDATQFDWFTEKFNRNDANFLYPFTQLFGEYLLKLPVETQKKGMASLEKVARSASNDYIRFNAYQTLGMFEELEGVKELRQELRTKETNPKLRELYESMK